MTDIKAGTYAKTVFGDKLAKKRPTDKIFFLKHNFSSRASEI